MNHPFLKSTAKSSRALLPATALLSILCACSTNRYAYRATEPTPLTPKGVPGVTYEISPPQGQLRIAAMGTLKLKALNGTTVFVVRYYLENKSGRDWKIEPALQHAVFNGEPVTRSPLATTLGASQRVFEAKSGKAQVFDLLYAYSPDKEPTSFALDWQVGALTARAGRVEFVRAEVGADSLEGNYVEQDMQVYLQPGVGVYRTIR